VEAMNYWLTDLSSKSPATQTKYQSFFERFCASVGKTPNELIEQRKIDLKANDPREAKGCENYLKNFIVKLRDEGNSPATQQIAYAAVRSFFESNEFPLKMKRSDYPQGESLGSRAITKPVIREILEDKKHIRYKMKMKALIMVAKDSGQGVTEIGNLTYGMIRKGLEANQDFIMLHLIRQKTHTVAKPVLGPEAIDALKEYLAERQHGTRNIPAEELTDDSPLFKLSQGYAVKRISRGGLSSMIRYQCLKHGVKLSAHSFRKYVQTSLDNAGVSPNIIDRLLGHKLPGSRDPYSQPSDEDMLEAYKKAYDHLRVYQVQNEAELTKRLRIQVLLDFAKAEGYDADKIKRLEDVLARGKDVDEAITEFRKLQGNDLSQNHKENHARQPRHVIAKGNNELLRKLDEGYKLMETLDGNRFLLNL
jgi:integrase